MIDEMARARRPRNRLARERPYLIDPSKEDPSQFIGFDWVGGNGFLVRPFGRDGASGRGFKTIEILGLDRVDLNMERAQLLSTLEGIAMEMKAGQYFDKPALIRRAAARIRQATSASRTFAGFAREYFRASNLGNYVAND